MNDQAMRFRFGIFVLAALILLAVLVMLFGGVTRYFATNDPYTIIVDNAQGITPGTPVRRSGVKIGEVRTVELNNATGKVTLSILVQHGFTLRKSDRPTIMRGLLGGDTTIDFIGPDHPKQIDETPVPVGTVLVGVTPAEAGELVQKTGDLIVPAKDALVEMQKVLKKIDKMAPLLEDALQEFREVAKVTRGVAPDIKKTGEEFQLTARVWGKVGERLDVFLLTNEPKLNKSVDQLEESLRRVNQVLSDENQKNLNATLKNARVASDQFESIAKNSDEMIKQGRVTLKNLNDTVLKADDVFGNLQKFTKPFSERTPIIMKNLDDSTTSLNKMLIDFRDLTRDIARSEGTLQKLITDPSLYNNLNDSAIMVTKILPRLDRILSDVEIFADKIARHPESLGIGGVFRPGSGLKESPSVLPWKEPTGQPWHIWHSH
jgi:phospholipid/cholesterol/gamma-HCH transport system substrate-binding protein